MIDYVRKRHAGDGWQVFTELANGTGYKVRGWADAAALGIWPSRGYELHGYEFKASREDLKKELRDPAKADNVGRYCHYWWLVLAKEQLSDGLVIPSSWGLLVPKGGVLRTLRKAPKNAKAKPFDPAFVAAMIRNVTKTWVPRHEHDALKQKQRDQIIADLEREQTYQRDDLQQRVEELEKRIAAFEIASGIKINSWNAGSMGEAVRRVLELRHDLGREAHERTLRAFANAAEQHERLAERAHAATKQLQGLLDDLGAEAVA